VPPSFSTPTDLPTVIAGAINLDGRQSRLVWDVKEYGAKGDGSTDDTSGIAAANAAANAAGGGAVYFPAGTYISTTQTIFSNIVYCGATNGASTVKLKNAANVDLFATDQFASLFGGSTQAGPSRFVIRDLTLDGNKANQSATSYPLSIYGSNFAVERVQVINGFSGGVRSRWGTGGSNMESYWSSCKLVSNNGQQLDFQGPHDSVFNGLIAQNGGTFATGQYGIHLSGNAGGELFLNCHVWGTAHEVGWYLQKQAHARNCVGEGAKINVWLDTSDIHWDGNIFGTGGTGPNTGSEIGVQIAHTATSIWAFKVAGRMSGFVSTDIPINLVGDNGGNFELELLAGTVTAITSGTFNGKSNVNIVCPDAPAFCQSSHPFVGAGVPANTFAVNGSYYCRTDPSGTGTHLYFKSGGTWTGLTSATL